VDVIADAWNRYREHYSRDFQLFVETHIAPRPSDTASPQSALSVPIV